MVLDQLGDPNAVMVDAYGTGDGQQGSYMALYYSDDIVRMILVDHDSSNYRLAKDTHVDMITYHEKGFFVKYFEDKMDKSPWSGYEVSSPDT